MPTETRQSDLFNEQAVRDASVMIVGLGAIGHQVARAIIFAGANNLILIDPQIIGEENVLTQGYPRWLVGHSKVRASGSILLARDRTTVPAHLLTPGVDWREEHPGLKTVEDEFRPGMLSLHYMTNGAKVVISCVDSMQVRQDIFNSVCEFGLPVFFIDARMAGHVLRVLTVDTSIEEEKARYRRSLFSDAEAFQGTCTSRGTLYGAMMAGSLVTSQAISKLTGCSLPHANDVLIDLRAMEISTNGQSTIAGESVSA